MRAKLTTELTKAGADGVDVWPEHWHAVNVFLAMARQWRTTAGMTCIVYHDIDYAALPPVLEEHRRIRHRQPMRRLMPQLRTLTAAAAEEMNKE